MPLDPHIQAVLHQYFCNTLDLISRSRHESCFPAAEESKFMKADHESFRGHAQDNLLALDLFAQCLMELLLQFNHVDAGVRRYGARPGFPGAGWTLDACV